MLYTPLQKLDVVLRSRIHAVMITGGHERWYQDEGFLVVNNQRDQPAVALTDLRRQGRGPRSGRIAAALSFSLWASMLSSACGTLCQTTLHEIACREDGRGLRRKDLAAPLTPIRVSRNRIAHRESILSWNLPKYDVAIMQIMAWLSPAALGCIRGRWCRNAGPR